MVRKIYLQHWRAMQPVDNNRATHRPRCLAAQWDHQVPRIPTESDSVGQCLDVVEHGCNTQHTSSELDEGDAR